MKFAPNNLTSYICPHIFENSRPILLVVHDDGEWQFLCGGNDHGHDCHIVGIGHLVDRDPSINKCADLPNGFMAQRAALDQPWTRCSIEESDH